MLNQKTLFALQSPGRSNLVAKRPSAPWTVDWSHSTERILDYLLMCGGWAADEEHREDVLQVNWKNFSSFICFRKVHIGEWQLWGWWGFVLLAAYDPFWHCGMLYFVLKSMYNKPPKKSALFFPGMRCLRENLLSKEARQTTVSDREVPSQQTLEKMVTKYTDFRWKHLEPNP